ncbi:MAG: response regulator [Desulfobacterales bacterium]|nr:response regulator [Desulfobacterales bacterium]
MADKAQVLIMEDEMDMRFYLTALVKSMELEPVMTRNGIQGLGILKQQHHAVDLIILDIMMPDKGGALVYRELKTLPEYRDIPLVIFSGVEQAAFCHYIRMLNAESGLDIPQPEYYVEKTADPEYLKTIINRCLNRTSTSPSA